MGAVTQIAWCDHPLHPWWGGTQGSPLCDRCDAMMRDLRWFKRAQWGPGASRRSCRATYWRAPLQGERSAHMDGRRPRLFCARDLPGNRIVVLDIRLILVSRVVMGQVCRNRLFLQAFRDGRDRYGHIPPNYVVRCVTTHRKPPEVRIWRLSIQSDVGTRPPSTSTSHGSVAKIKKYDF
jgi:hypothetical protein